MEPADHLRIVGQSADDLLGAAAGSLGRPVPSCPGWDVADLVEHVGLTWGWAADIVATGTRAERGAPPPDRDEAQLLAWASAQAARLCATLGAADPESDCWTFGLPRTRRFWIRRQALETVLHAWDVRRAVGDPPAIDAEVAADGVDEYLGVMVPRWAGRHPGVWNGETLHLHRTDGDGEWLVTLGPGADVSAERVHGKGDVALRGTAEALWLWCCNRESVDALGIEVFGDRTLADRWSSQITF